MVIIIILFSFVAEDFSLGAYSGRIIPMGRVSVYKGDQKVGEFNEEAPFPEGFVLECNKQCVVKLDDLYLVAADKSMFSVTTKTYRRELRIEEGTIYFALRTLPRSLAIITAEGDFTVHEVRLNASSDGNFLKGYVSVKPATTEIGVIEGGSMLVSTTEGEKIIKAGERITIAQVDLDIDDQGVEAPAKPKGAGAPAKSEDVTAPPPTEVSTAPPAAAPGFSMTSFVIGSISSAVLTAAIFAFSNDSGGTKEASPFAPTQ
jgi:hypothetical protein